jgi:proteic killer suppression protein
MRIMIAMRERAIFFKEALNEETPYPPVSVARSSKTEQPVDVLRRARPRGEIDAVQTRFARSVLPNGAGHKDAGKRSVPARPPARPMSRTCRGVLPAHGSANAKSFKNARAGKSIDGRRVVELVNIEEQARTRLIRLGSATCLNDLRALRGNLLEALTGNRKGQFGIRINDQYRIRFKWKARGPTDVEITGYH